MPGPKKPGIFFLILIQHKKEFVMRLIVTHPGKAHRDDFIAICIILAVVGEDIPIERRHATQEDLDNTDTIVIDTGLIDDQWKNNFDHHQFPTDHPAACSITLVLKAYDLYRKASFASPWLHYTEVFDSKGPMVAQEEFGLEDGAWEVMQSPIETQVLSIFAAHSKTPYWIINMMRLMGGNWLEYWDRYVETNRRLNISDGCSSHVLSIRDNVQVLVIEWPYEEIAMGAVHKYCKENAIAGTITRDDRPAVVVNGRMEKPGWCLFRYNDHESIDFKMVKDDPRVRFTHSNGFVSKTDDISLEEALALFVTAIVPMGAIA
jgi:hypothetical protein